METWLPEIEEQLTRVMAHVRWPFTTVAGVLGLFVVVLFVQWLRVRRFKRRTLFAQKRRAEAEAQWVQAEERIARARRNLGEHRVWTEAPDLLNPAEREELYAHQKQRSVR
jgi:hypothetical protein